ncbi:hypothetical protein AVEN_107415-1 [Araneus ventricosus]|uniref:Uncharacterized protein n=1 Tax=Araneus ventricosus TaxID=182803 RepID=A0A4Y2JBK7_ARAVE|nr:hypothetical protein AVEN_107415-1 [Araneus ventricosus]
MIGCGLELHVNDRVKHPTRSVLEKLVERFFDFLKGLLDVISNHRGVQLYDHFAAEVGRAIPHISVGSLPAKKCSKRPRYENQTPSFGREKAINVSRSKGETLPTQPGYENNRKCAIIFAANLFCNRGVKFVMTFSRQTCLSGLVEYALLLCRKFVSKLPRQVCHDKLISRKIKLAASVHVIWGTSGIRLISGVILHQSEIGSGYSTRKFCVSKINKTENPTIWSAEVTSKAKDYDL